MQLRGPRREASPAAPPTPGPRRPARRALIPLALAPLVSALVAVPGADARTSETGRPWSPAAETTTVRVLGIGEFSGALSRPVGFQGELRDGSGNVRPAGGGPQGVLPEQHVEGGCRGLGDRPHLAHHDEHLVTGVTLLHVFDHKSKTSPGGCRRAP